MALDHFTLKPFKGKTIIRRNAHTGAQNMSSHTQPSNPTNTTQHTQLQRDMQERPPAPFSSLWLRRPPLTAQTAKLWNERQKIQVNNS